MTLGSLSRLSPVESQPQCSEMRRHISPSSKIRESLVVERSSLKPSTPDYTPHFPDSISLFTSSSHLSGQVGRIFQEREHTQLFAEWSPAPWEGTNLDQNTFPPFYEPKATTKDSIWSSNPATPVSSIFGPPNASTQDLSYVHPFTNHVSQIEPPVDFTQNQRGGEQQFDEKAFEEFLQENDTDDQRSGLENSNIYLEDDASAQALIPQTVPEPQAVSMQLPNCGLNLTYPINTLGYPATFPLRKGCLSSESSDDGECNQHRFAPRPKVCEIQRNETRDAETQTLHGSTFEICHVATQCNLWTSPPPTVLTQQQEATRGHSLGILQKSKHYVSLHMSLQKIFKGIVVRRPPRHGNSGVQQVPVEKSVTIEARLDPAMNCVEVDTHELTNILLMLKQRHQGND
ncbi:uncharacterized protein LOC130917138 isoform X2 [Corythoichthys intestinalis]|nr:uncharacterized protein LOC130917138 isoform X2 [Corythoichthys intestinalis]